MKPYFIITLLFSTAFLNVAAQVNKPEEKSIVNKEYDEEGNLIKYDSTFVWSWSGDSAFQFDFPMNGFFAGKDFPGFNEMFSDSALSSHFNHPLFNFDQFDNDEFFGQFEHQFPDSAFSQHFDFFGDSAFVFPFDFGAGSGNDFFSKDFENLHEELLDRLGDKNFGVPQFETDEQQKAWEELMEKQEKEKQELLYQWKKQQKTEGTNKKEKPQKVY
jgi:hypothetical protein